MYENLNKNKDRLSTPFDIYSTLLDVIHTPSVEDLKTLQDPKKQRSLSLFREIPEARNCDQVIIREARKTLNIWNKNF